MSTEAIALQLVVWLPLIGAVLIGVLGSGNLYMPRRIAMVISVLTLGLSEPSTGEG